jgi:hypothetical protein
MSGKGIRKVSLSTELREELSDYAWMNRVSSSRIIRDILVEIAEDAEAFSGSPDDDAKRDTTLTVYVPDEEWQPARDSAYWARTSMASAIRRGIKKRIADGVQVL